MKKYLFTMATATMLFASCSSDDTVVDNGVNEEGLVAIKLGTNAKVGVESRAAVETWNGGEKVGIFALDRSEAAIWNDKDEVKDDKAVLLANAEGTIGTGTPEFVIALAAGNYYPRSSERLYDFYGYYPRITGETEVSYGDETNPATITVTGTFTGQEDVIAGKAELPSADSDEHFSIAWNTAYYRAHTKGSSEANDPVIAFKHMTSRFKIILKKGEPFTAGNSTVTGLTMALPTEYYLAFEKGKYPAISWGKTTNDAIIFTQSEAEEEAIVEGQIADFMVPAVGPEHEFTLTFNGKDAAGKNITSSVKVDINKLILPEDWDKEEPAPTAFQPGKIYTITLTIYGPQEIKVKGTLENWTTGGSFDLDA